MKFTYDKHEFQYDKNFLPSLLFMAVSGSHSYGWNRKDSDLDVRIVWMPSLLQALSVEHKGKSRHFIIDNIDYEEKPLHNYLRLLVKGNGNALENLFQHKLYENKQKVDELQKITLTNLHKGFLKHYLGYYASLQKDLSNPTRIEKYGMVKLLLCSYRVLQAGIILAEKVKVEPNVEKQAKMLGTRFCSALLEQHRSGSTIVYASKDYLGEIEALKKRLEKNLEESEWYSIFPSNDYDKWLVKHYT